MFSGYINVTRTINDILRQVEVEAAQSDFYPPSNSAKEAASILLEEIFLAYQQYLMVYPISHSIVIDISLRNKSSVVFICAEDCSIMTVVNGVNGGTQCLMNYPANAYDISFVNNLVDRSLKI